MCVCSAAAPSARNRSASPSLRSDDDAARDGLLEERTETPVAIDRAAGEARARNDQRYPPKTALTIEVGPELRLDDDRDPRAGAIEEASYRSGQIERQEPHLGASRGTGRARAWHRWA